MAFNGSKTRTWTQQTPADGDIFDDEFDRIYANDNYLKSEVETKANQTDYTALETRVDTVETDKANASDVSTALSAKVNTADIQDNLTSTETAKPTSARATSSLLLPGFIIGRTNYYSSSPTIVRIPKWNIYEVGKRMIRIESELTLDFSATTNIYRNDGATPIAAASETQSKHLYLMLSDTGSLSAMIMPDLDLDTGTHVYLANPKLVKDALSATPAIFDISKNGYYKNSKRIIGTLRLNASNQIEFLYELGFGHRYMDVEKHSVSESYNETRWLREHPNCLIADGSTVTSMSTDYPMLYKYLGTNVLPSWADRVARGIAVGGSRAIRDTQEDAFMIHYHDIFFEGGSSQKIGHSGSGVYYGGNTTNKGTDFLAAMAPKTDGINGTPRTANETRMKNYAVSIQIVRG